MEEKYNVKLASLMYEFIGIPQNMKKRKRNLLPSLREHVNKPFKEKLLISQGFISRNLLKYKRHYVAFSGGKDSLVVLHLVRQLKKDILVMFNNTGIEYQETYDFIDFLEKEWKLNLIRTKPEKSFWQCIKEYGVPDMKGSYRKGSFPKCCYWLKEKPAKLEIRSRDLDCCFDGLTASESRQRMFTIAEKGVCYDVKKWELHKVHPIAYWTEEDVWYYIKKMKLPYNKIYDKGYPRCGCAYCTCHLNWKWQVKNYNFKVYKFLLSKKEDGQQVLENK